MPSALISRTALLTLVALPALAGPADVVYRGTRHGDPAAGVSRLSSLPRGACTQCHVTRGPAGGAPFLFGPDDNTLCFTCHAAALGAFEGRAIFEATPHWTSGLMRWPGPTPAARPTGDQGKCVNCHTPHGAKDARGLVPDLGHTREEALCTACHDSTGPSAVNVLADLTKASAHPVTAYVGRHLPGEAGGAAFSGAQRHAECADCHNPHAAQAGATAGGLASKTQLNVSRVRVANGAANTAPSYTFLPASDTSAAAEYELCFKCHSGYATLPAGAKDKGVELNPANGSFHPVEAAGRNATAAMAASLDGGTGSPKLTVGSVVWCSDCHSSEAVPTTVTRVSGYTGAAATGPHGSNAAAGNAAYSTALLRAAYRVTPYGSTAYNQADFALCFICHSPAPFGTTSSSARADTNFRFHGFHVRGQRAICRECHESTHGTALAAQTTQRSNGRLVAYYPGFTAPGGGAPSWSQAARTCTVTCHGMNHNAEGY